MLKEKVLKNRILLTDMLCFVLAALGMYFILEFAGFGIWGEYSIISGDMKENYIPAIVNICRNIKAGDSIFYSLMYGMGSNMSLYNAYYSYSPFNILYFIFNKCNMNVITIVNIVMKTGLAALTFRIYARKSLKASGLVSIVFSIFYSLCAYQIVFNVQNIIWLDALFVLPMIWYGLHKLIGGERAYSLVFWYAYIFISQFYMGYMIGIASFIYFVILVFMKIDLKDKAKLVKTGLGYFVLVLLSIGISACAWLPAFIYLVSQNVSTVSEFAKLHINIIDVINQLFWGEVSGYDATFPYIYCGTPAAVLMVLFFADKKNELKEKIGNAVMLLLFILSCLFVPLYATWHGFDVPDSYGFRFSFIISFMICSIAVMQMERMKEMNKTAYIGVLILFVAVYVAAALWQGVRFDSYKISNDLKCGIVNCIFLGFWLFVLWKWNGNREKCIKVASLLIVMIALVESITNGFVMMDGRDPGGRRLLKSEYDAWKSNSQWISSELQKDNDLYRVCSYQDFGASTGINYGYNTVSFFGSSENVKLRNVLGYLGLWNTPRSVRSFGMTEPVKTLLGIKYNTYADPYDRGLVNSSKEFPVLRMNEYYSGIGFLVEGNVEDYNCLSANAIEGINALLTVMTGNESRVFFPIDSSIISVEENGLSLIAEEDGLIIRYDENEKVDLQDADVTFRMNCTYDGNFYAYIDNEASYFTGDAYKIDGGDENYIDHNGAMTVSYIKNMEMDNNNPVVRIVSEGFDGKEKFRGIYFYYFSYDEFEKVYKNLNKKVLNVLDYSNGYIKGTIDGEDAQKLLYVSVPYEKGWKAYVDGIETAITPIIYDSFIAVPITGEGVHEVELKFEAPGQKWGIAISGISFIIAAFCLLMRKKKYE